MVLMGAAPTASRARSAAGVSKVPSSKITTERISAGPCAVTTEPPRTTARTAATTKTSRAIRPLASVNMVSPSPCPQLRLVLQCTSNKKREERRERLGQIGAQGGTEPTSCSGSGMPFRPLSRSACFVNSVYKTWPPREGPERRHRARAKGRPRTPLSADLPESLSSLFSLLIAGTLKHKSKLWTGGRRDHVNGS